MYYSQSARLAIYAEGAFGKGSSKTAEGVIRYGKNPIVAIIDSSEAGKKVKDILVVDCEAPIVSSVDEALAYKPDALLLGTAWAGGKLPKHWLPDIKKALNAGLDIVNGLHDFLADDPEIVSLAASKNCKLFDVRKSPQELPVASGKALDVDAFTVLTVGSDCSAGKMTVSLELNAEAVRRGFKSRFVATGQTGIMIAGHGIAIDRVIGDFMAGATEKIVLEAAPNADYVFVEGQASLVHPGFSGVTLAILHGSCPKALVLCHNASRHNMKGMEFPIPDLAKLVSVNEAMAAWMRPAKVVAIALNTSSLSENEAKEAIKNAELSCGLPADDPVRFGAGKLFDAVNKYKETCFASHDKKDRARV